MKAEKCRLLMKNDSFLDYLEAGRDVCVRCFRKMWQRNFVPKIPSMKIKDFMISLAPGCGNQSYWNSSSENARNFSYHSRITAYKELDDRFVILPE